MIARFVALVLGFALLVGAAVHAPGRAAAAEAPEAASRTSDLRGQIDNLIVVVQQNHTYDSYFGNYPRGEGYGGVRKWPTAGDGTPIKPFLWTAESIAPFFPKVGEEPLSNGTNAAHVAMANGQMDGFAAAQRYRGFPDQLAMATHDKTTAPTLWQLADEFVLFDHYFSSTLGGSLPNALHLFTGDDHGLTFGADSQLAMLARTDPDTMFDRLSAGGVSWRFYSGLLGDLDPAAITAGNYQQADGSPASVLYWAPFLVLPRFWTTYGDQLRSQDDFFADSARGQLPSVSVVLPQPMDHPMNVTAGNERLRSLVNAVEKSPQWDRTAMLIVWDDWGGFYDHVPPPPGHGFRVPMLLVSPHARRGYIDSNVRDHNSVLQFVLEFFGLAPLGPPSPEEPSLAEVFDLDAQPRTAHLLAGAALPTPVVGTQRQNSLTLRLYLVPLLLVAVLAVPAARWANRRSRGVPVGSLQEVPVESQA